MKAKVSILAKPHPYIFFTLQLDSMLESSAPIHAVIMINAVNEYLSYTYILITMTSLQSTQALGTRGM